MTTHQFGTDAPDRDHRDDTVNARHDEIPTPILGDTAIIEGTPEAPVRGQGGQPLYIEVGAQVFSSDGEDVAVVEITGADTIGIRAGSPGRSIVLPTRGIARVAADGRRIDLHATAEEVRDLSAAEQPGSKHLAAQQPGTLAHESQPEAGVPLANEPSARAGGYVGPAGETTEMRDAR